MKSEMKSRDIRLDALRGLFLTLMAAVHLPTPLSHALQEPFGYIGNAEGFVFLSACLSGLVYGKIYRQNDWATMARRVWQRTRLIYFIHLGLVVSVALVAWVASNHLPSLANHFHDFLLHPLKNLALLPLLLHQPPLFDILPLYVIFLGATPWLLALARRHGWRFVLLVSVVGWLGAQSKWDTHPFGDPARWLALHGGSFNLLAWQFLWVAGVAVGEISLRANVIPKEFRRSWGTAAALVVAAGLLSRHGWWPSAWFSPDLFLWMDKWTLGPLRLLNFAAWVVLLLVWNPRLSGYWLSPLALLGRHSLAVFSFHLPLTIAAVAVIGIFAPSAIAQTLIGLLVVFALFPWAAWRENRRRREIPVVVTSPVRFGEIKPAWMRSSDWLASLAPRRAANITG